MKIEMINSFNIGDLIGLVGVILGIIGTYIIATISERRLNRKEKKKSVHYSLLERLKLKMLIYIWEMILLIMI